MPSSLEQHTLSHPAQWVNESQPSYGKQIGNITLDDTNYAIEISNDDYNILDNANYVNEISNDDLNIVKNINYEAVLPIEQNDDEFEESVILGTPQNNDDAFEGSVILGSSQLLEGSKPMLFYEHNILEYVNDVVVLPVEQNNDDVLEGSVILGSLSILSVESDQLQLTNTNKRKARVSNKARKSEPLGNCRNDCKSKVEDNLREQLFELYWSMGNYSRRAAYISKLIVCSDKVSSRKRRDTPEKQKPKEKTYKYYIPKNGNLIIVCKLCFMEIFGETRSFLRNVCINMLSSPAHRCSPDKRGRNTPGNKRSNDDIKILINHLNKLPSYESHYYRKETSKKYLPSHCTLKLAYDMYKNSVENPVCMTIYAQYFKNSGLKVKNPKKDTCAKCDKYKIQLTDNNNSSEQRNKLIEEKIKHQDEAEFAYQSKRNDISDMSTDKCVISFDLQQCLPTPSLENSVVFYKRQLWTYNLIVHNCTTSQAYCYIWYETIAKRGANEIDLNIQFTDSEDEYSSTSYVPSESNDTSSESEIQADDVQNEPSKQYISSRGKIIPAKQYKDIQCLCNEKCHDLLTFDQKKNIFDSYYSLGSHDLQTSYLCSLINVIKKKRSYVKNSSDSRKEFSRIYYLPLETGITIKVCKDFFKKSFNISDGRITRALTIINLNFFYVLECCDFTVVIKLLKD
ncbi:hypothetical protein ACI65C_013596 [Semiaphis heraclei]